MDDKVEVEIANRRLAVEIAGLTPMEIHSVADMVNEKLNETRLLNPKVVDTAKLAIFALLHLAADLYRIQQDDARLRRSNPLTARLPRLDLEDADSYKPYICALTDMADGLRRMMLKAEAKYKK